MADPDLARYLNLLVDLAMNLVAAYVLAVVLYYRKYARADMLLAFFALDIGVFVSMSLLSSLRNGFIAGFGMFAILSILQLRSKMLTQEEVAYYFAVLIVGVVNGLRLEDLWMAALLNVAVIALTYVVDNRRFFVRAQRVEVTLDRVHTDDASLVQDLERRLRGRVRHHVVEDVDHVRDTMVVDVRFVPDNPAGAYERR